MINNNYQKIKKTEDISLHLSNNILTQPNFFILGAPKCGTTSLAEWLNGHPSVFVCNPKEPRFFNTDWHFLNRPHTKEDYEQLFVGAEGYNVIGEATTGYLSSKIAVSKILAYNPSAKFVVCLRDPIEMVSSLHAQRLKEGLETEHSLTIAWKQQTFRSLGKQIPATCTDFKTLLYGQMCSLGEQVDRLLGLVDRNRVCFVLLEDLKKDPVLEYRRILEFLGIEDDRRSSFPVKNMGRIPRLLWLAQIGRILARLKKQLGICQNFGIQSWFNQYNEVPRENQKIDPELQAELIDYFKDDVKKLSKLINKDLSHWLSSRTDMVSSLVSDSNK